ncbi:MAG: hemerythrin domain-containing protein [Nitrospirales bacterium]|nr:hemerythrin domain-containing protein [Nitrospirales bacterium]
MQQFLVEDHARLDDLLERTIQDDDRIDHEVYKEFRRGLLRHIAMEEKVLFPTVQRLKGGTAVPLTAKLRLDHGALGALIMPTPTLSLIKFIGTILDGHNALEEGPEGVYEQCEQVAEGARENILQRLQAVPPVMVADFSDSLTVVATIRRIWMRAGYSTESLEFPVVDQHPR